MKAQPIENNIGLHGVFISMKDWEIIKAQYPDIEEVNNELVKVVIDEIKKESIKKIEYEPYFMKFNIDNNKPFNEKINNINIPFNDKKIKNGYSFYIIEKNKEVEEIKSKTLKDTELFKLKRLIYHYF